MTVSRKPATEWDMSEDGRAIKLAMSWQRAGFSARARAVLGVEGLRLRPEATLAEAAARWAALTDAERDALPRCGPVTRREIEEVFARL